MISKREDKSISRLVDGLLNETIAVEEERQLIRIYDGLKTLQGIGHKEITDASVTINETLYGETNVSK